LPKRWRSKNKNGARETDSKEDIDAGVKGSFGFRLAVLGPLQTMDMGGLDLMYRGMRYLYPLIDRSVDVQKILREKGVKCVIVVGTAAHGAVLHTATGAAQRGFQVIVPVDGMSADPYAEQYTAWHLANGPGSRSQTTMTRFSMIRFKE